MHALFNSNNNSSSLAAESVSADESETIEADSRVRMMCFQMRFSNDSYVKTVTNEVSSQLVQCVHLCDRIRNFALMMNCPGKVPFD